MTKKTPEEKFVLKLYEMALLIGDIYSDIDMFAVGKELGLKEKGVKIIVRNLCQANFIKKYGDATIAISSQGERLVSSLKNRS